jgi:hypothetical protein
MQGSHSSVFRIPGCRNTEMSLALVLSGFHDSGNRDARVPLLCLSGSQVAEIPKCLGARSFRISRFRESRCKDPAPLSFEFPVAEIPKCRNAEIEALDQWLTTPSILYGQISSPPLTSSQLHFIQRLAVFRDSPQEFSTVRSDLRDLLSRDLHSVKVCASPSNRTVCGIFHHDPTLDDVLPPELLLTSDLEYFLSLRRLGLRSFQGMSSWISITLSEALSLLSFVLFRPRFPRTPCI